MATKDTFGIGTYLAAFVALLDQSSKNWFLSSFSEPVPFVKITPFLNFRLSWNKGVTFGLLNDFSPWMPYFLIAVAVAIMLLLLNWLRHVKTLTTAMGLGFVMGGAVGNVIDRVRFGAVVDFIDFHIADYHWYTFNVADSAILAGVGLLLLENFVQSRR